jgi:hypothetical protein
LATSDQKIEVFETTTEQIIDVPSAPGVSKEGLMSPTTA